LQYAIALKMPRRLRVVVSWSIISANVLWIFQFTSSAQLDTKKLSDYQVASRSDDANCNVRNVGFNNR